jgi:hypothetical protein
MKTKLSILILFTSLLGFSQETVLSSGKDASGAGGVVNYSIGQVAYISGNGAGGTASQGVQQPFEIYLLGVDNFPNISMSFAVYPNPTTSFVVLKMATYNSEKLQYEMFDLSGKKIESKPINAEEMQIQMQKYASGIYILQIIDQSKIIKTFKIIKN